MYSSSMSLEDLERALDASYLEASNLYEAYEVAMHEANCIKTALEVRKKLSEIEEKNG